jgi:DNA invertase Pin-like site-specific DNA recombinase
MAIVGYARVSTGHQTTDGQRDALTAAGCDPIFEEKLSGARRDRPELAKMLDHVQAGDTVVVCALDRLGRSLSGIVHTVEQLQRKGVLLRSLREGIDYSTAVGRMVAGIFAALAEYERDLIHERAAAAAAAARARGKHVGRPRTMNDDKIRAAQAMLAGGESVSTVCSALSVPRSTLYRTLREVAGTAV